MSEDNNLGTVTLTAPVIMAFPALITPKSFKRNGKEQGEPTFRASFLFDPTNPDLRLMKEVAARVARARWPSRDLKELKFPFASGDGMADKRKSATGKDDGDFQRGKVVVKARSKYRPRLAYIQGGKLFELETDEAVAAARDKFFFGAECLAIFNFVAYDGGTGPDGVTAYLQNVLSTGKGTKLSSGGQTAAEAFGGYLGTISAEDPLAGLGDGLDDDIPF